MDTVALVLDTLAKSDEPMKAGQVAEALGIDKTEVDKALKALKVEDKITSPKRCFYTVA